MTDAANTQPRPRPDADTAAFWDGLSRGELLLQHCLTCDAAQYYQQVICRSCGAETLEHRPASGRGVVHSFSVVHRSPGPEFADEVPYAVILVELAEGPRMISRLVDADPATADFDLPVELVCVPGDDGISLPCFRPTHQAGTAAAPAWSASATDGLMVAVDEP